MLLNKHKKYGTELIKAKQSFVDEMEDELKAMDDNFSRMLKSFQKDIDGIRKRATDFSTKLTSLCRREIYDLDVRSYRLLLKQRQIKAEVRTY